MQMAVFPESRDEGGGIGEFLSLQIPAEAHGCSGQNLEFRKIDEIHVPVLGGMQQRQELPEDARSLGGGLLLQGGAAVGKEWLCHYVDLKIVFSEIDDILHEIRMKTENFIDLQQVFRSVDHSDAAQFFVLPVVENVAALDGKTAGQFGKIHYT